MNTIADRDVIASALSHISPPGKGERELWVRIGMAIKSELGEEGRDLWDSWSRAGEGYKEADARAVWRSIKPGGGIGIGTLFHMAREAGWMPDAPIREESPHERAIRRREREGREYREAKERAQGYAKAALQAQTELAQTEPGEHPYLAEKGFPEHLGHVAPDGSLLIPMRQYGQMEICGLQRIYRDGEGWRKRFTRGMQASGAVYIHGRSYTEAWLVEGYATGLTVRAALDRIGIEARVISCFSDSNLVKVRTALNGSRIFAFSDNDASGAGERAAQRAGISYAMAPRPDGDKTVDANDHHQSAGLLAVCKLIVDARR